MRGERAAGRVMELEVGGGVERVKEWDQWGEESQHGKGKVQKGAGLSSKGGEGSTRPSEPRLCR